MKRILGSLLIIAVVAGLMGASLADFSDIETSHGNIFATGSMDLKVSDAEGILYEDPDVPILFQAEDAWPECPAPKTAIFDLHNEGQGDQFIPTVYIHFMDVVCSGIDIDIVTPGLQNPEPENAAELGTTPVGVDANGNPVYAATDPTQPASATNPALIGGPFGDDCTLSKHVDVTIWTARTNLPANDPGWQQVDLDAYDTNENGIIKLDELVCHQIPLGQLANAEPEVNGAPNPDSVMYVKLQLNLQDVPEELLGFDLFDETTIAEAKWNAWPTNALMKDQMTFDMGFELLQFPPDHNLVAPVP